MKDEHPRRRSAERSDTDRDDQVVVTIIGSVLLLAMVIGLSADWRAFVALPPLVEALRRLIETVMRKASGRW